MKKQKSQKEKTEIAVPSPERPINKKRTTRTISGLDITPQKTNSPTFVHHTIQKHCLKDTLMIKKLYNRSLLTV